MAEWIEWKGGKCPVDGDTFVDVMCPDKDVCPGALAKTLRWEWIYGGEGGDIIAYRVVDAELDETPDPSEIKSQPYYLLFPEQNIQVKDVNKALCDKHDALDNKVFTSHELAWVVQATQYIFRSPFKENTLQDLRKAVEALNIVIESYQSRIEQT